MPFLRIFALLPFPLLYAFSNVLAWLLNHVVRYRRRVIDDNLRHAFPSLSPAEIRQLRRQFYSNFSDLWLEALKGLHLSAHEYRKRVKIQNPELLLQFLEQGRPVMVYSSHRAGWEWLTPSHSAILQVPIDAVYKRVKSKFFNKLMLRIRSRFGARMVEKEELLRDSIRRSQVPRLLAIMSDQRPYRATHAYWTLFMNRPTPFYTASEKLARKLKMPVTYADMQRVGRGHYVVHYHLISDRPETEPEHAITERYVQLIEEGIRREPAAYLWTHKRWKHKPPAELAAALLSAGENAPEIRRPSAKK
jgi:KDO2-lipid IV(A) lauroyltransferase